MRWPWQRRPAEDGHTAARARAEEERRLREQRRRWSEVHQARDRLADWVDAALRGRP